MKFKPMFTLPAGSTAGRAGSGTRQTGVRRLLTSALVILFIAASAGQATGQVDTPAAREARAIVAELEREVATTERGRALRALPLDDLMYELRAGERAEPAALVLAAAQIRAAKVAAYREPRFVRLAALLDWRAAELLAIPRAEWPAACRERAKHPVEILPEQVEAGRQQLAARLQSLERRLPRLASPQEPWHSFLHWPQTQALLTSQEIAPATSELLATRWRSAMQVWDAEQLVDASFAVREYLCLLRGWLAHETPADQAAAWEKLATLLESSGDGAIDRARQIAALVAEREQLNQASGLTASIRRDLSRPNILVQARTEWLQAQLADKVEDRYAVNDVFGGARSVGSGTISGRMSCEILPSTAVGQAIFKLDGTANARTTGSSDRVTVSSRATTELHGQKRFTLDGRGLTASPATATARTSVVYDSIDSPGLRRRQAEATRQTQARRPQAEADAAAATRRSIVEQMNTSGTELTASFNRGYRDGLRDRLIDRDRNAPEIRVRAANGMLRWECLLESPGLFAAPSPPPEFAPGADLTVSLAASALEEECHAGLAGKELTGEKLAEVMAEMLGDAPATDRAAQNFRATFADRPCDVEFTAGQFRAKFYITSFHSDDVAYPAMTVDARYNVEQRGGDLALVRDGSLRVRPLATHEGEQPALSGRQQTLRLAAQRKLNKAFASTFTWPAPKLPLGSGEPVKMRIDKSQVDDGWLQISLAREK